MYQPAYQEQFGVQSDLHFATVDGHKKDECRLLITLTGRRTVSLITDGIQSIKHH